MKIIETNFKFTSLSKRSTTKYIVLHHAVAYVSAETIHQWHLNQGWSGIGYHFYVRKDGSIYRGRPLDMIGAHVKTSNSNAVGICAEGDYETKDKTMPEAQKKSIAELIDYLKKMYPSAQIVGHGELMATACPGKYYPLKDMKNYKNLLQKSEPAKAPAELTTVNDIVWELAHRGIITDKALWLKKLEEDKDSYWLARKCCNMMKLK